MKLYLDAGDYCSQNQKVEHTTASKSAVQIKPTVIRPKRATSMQNVNIGIYNMNYIF